MQSASRTLVKSPPELWELIDQPDRMQGLMCALIGRATEVRRVMQVFIPTLLFCLLVQWLGLYVASFLLIAGFMWWVGRIAVWKSVLTSLVFSAVMFATFEIAFNVIMPKGPLEAAFGF